MPPPSSGPCDSVTAILDAEHLRLLSLGFYVSSGVCAFFSLFGAMYMVMGLFMALMFSRMPPARGQAPPPFIGWFFFAIGAVGFCLLILMAILKFRAARCLRARRSRTFCMVIAALSCLEVPYGTTLGVFTLMVLNRYSIKSLFGPLSESEDLTPPVA